MAVTLNARARSTYGKNAARKLRQRGVVPAIIYGHGDETRPLEVSLAELQRLLTKISVENTLIDVVVEGGSTTSALIREVQYHPSRPQILHIDFLQVHAGEKLHMQVPVRLHGTPVGVRVGGGVLQEVLHHLDVECLPANIPEGVDIDVEHLDLGGSIHVGEVTLSNAKILNDAELVICAVTNPTPEALPVGSETEDGVGGDVQPALVRDRRKDADDTPFAHGSAQPE